MFDGRLNAFCANTNEVIRGKGFWDDMHIAMKTMHQFGEHEIAQPVKDAFIAQKIALVQSEASEALEAMRHQKYGIGAKDTFEDEIADVFIRLADLCGELNIDIEAQIEFKMGINKTRPVKHGKRF